MKIRAAVAWEAGATLSIEEFDLDDPRDDEILVRVAAVGVCFFVYSLAMVRKSIAVSK